jgi:hypothetical protein
VNDREAMVRIDKDVSEGGKKTQRAKGKGERVAGGRRRTSEGSVDGQSRHGVRFEAASKRLSQHKTAALGDTSRPIMGSGDARGNRGRYALEQAGSRKRLNWEVSLTVVQAGGMRRG